MPHLLPATRRTLLALALLLPTACTADTSTAPVTKPTTTPATRPLENAPFRVDFESTSITLKDQKFTLEIANTPLQTERGLMYRDAMPADHGMLFIMPTYEKTAFWMKNTRIPLDIIFLDQSGKVLQIDDRKPFDETGSGPSVPVRYVIELNAGTSQKIGLKKGDTIQIPAAYAKN